MQCDTEASVHHAGLACWMFGWAMCLALVAAAVQAQQRVDVRFELHISAGTMTLEADNLAVGEVLRRVAQALNARLSISGELPVRAGHWNLREVPIAEAVTQIARPASILIVQDRERASDRNSAVREIYVIGEIEAEANQTTAAELGRVDADDNIKALERALGDADFRVRVQAVESLGRIGTDEAIRLVGQTALGSKDPEVLAAAIRVLETSTSIHAGALLLAIKAGAKP